MRRALVCFLLTLTLLPGCRLFGGKKADEVWLLHGLGRQPESMTQLEACLQEYGYETRLWGYDSLEESITDIGARLHADLEAAARDKHIGHVHLVTHSMGGIVTRMAFADDVPRKTGRVVMLAPPNRGSWMAELVRPLVGKAIPAISELSDDPESLVNKLPPIQGVDVGIIAARFDSKAPVSSTYLRGAKDHVVVGGTHTYIMDRADVCAHVVHFLREGRFRAPENAERADAP